jgi:hypothetical protein
MQAHVEQLNRLLLSALGINPQIHVPIVCGIIVADEESLR